MPVLTLADADGVAAGELLPDSVLAAEEDDAGADDELQAVRPRARASATDAPAAGVSRSRGAARTV